MSIHTIYIDLGDEITTVIEKIKASHEPIVALVAPKGAVLTQSIVNLKLAKKAAIDAEKDLILVTGDVIGKNLAGQVGISVANSEKEVAAVARGEGAGSPDGADGAKVIAGVRIHRYYEEQEEAAGNADPETDAAPASEEKEPAVIVPKQFLSTAPKQPETSSEAIEATTQSASSEPSPDAEPSSLDSLIQEEVTEAPALETQTAPAAAPVAPAPMSVPIMTRRKLAPTPQEPPIVETVPGKKIEDTRIQSKAGTPAAPRPRRGKGLALVLLIIILLGAAAAGTGVFFLPKSEVVLTIKATPIEQSMELTAKADQAEISENGMVVPAAVLSEKTEVTLPFNATGKKKVGEAAKGTATLFNNGDSEPLFLPSGATLLANGRTFTTQADATVPGATFQAGRLTKIGQTTVPVLASEIGAESNLGETVIQITQPTGTRINGQITSTSGGTSQELTIVSAADIASAKTAAETQLRQALTGKIEEQLKNRDIRFEPNSDIVSIDSFTTSVPAGTEAPNAQAVVSGTVTRIGVDNKVLEQAAIKRMAIGQLATEQRIFEKIRDDVALTVNPEQKAIAITATYLAKSTPIFDPSSLNEKLAGKSLSAGRSLLLDTTPASNVTVSQNPSWWPLKRYPVLKKSITVSVTYE